MWEKSPRATRIEPSVRRRMGVTMVLDRGKVSSTVMTRPKTRASMMSRNIWSVRSLAVVLLSRI